MDDLGTIMQSMGGVPGGGMPGAMAAPDLLRLMQQKQAADIANTQALTNRTNLMAPQEANYYGALGNQSNAQAGHLGAETTGLNLGNFERATNLPGEIAANRAQFGAKEAGAGLQQTINTLTPYLSNNPGYGTIPADPDGKYGMREHAIDVDARANGWDKLPGWNGIKDRLMGGDKGIDVLKGMQAANPEIMKTNIEGQTARDVEAQRAGAQVRVAETNKASRENVAAAMAQARLESSSFKDPGARIRFLEDRLRDPNLSDSQRIAYQNEAQNEDRLNQQLVAIKGQVAQALQARGMLTPEIAQILAGQNPTNPAPVPGAQPNQTPSIAPGANPGTQNTNPGTQPNQAPRAINPATGQVLELRNGQWTPVQ